LYSLKKFNDQTFPEKKITSASLTKDISCILRMYVENNNIRSNGADSIICPFTELGLITAYSDSKRYIFNFGNKPTLIDEVIVASCLDFASRVENNATTISVSRLLYDSGSPGQLFKLSESDLCKAIEKISRDFPKVALSDTAGIIQFSYREDPSRLAEEIIEKYYGKRN